METAKKDPSRLNADVRTALKAQHLARIAAKEKLAKGEITPEEYSAMHASQPHQVERHKANQAERALRRAARAKQVAIGVEKAKGGAEAFKGGAE